MSVEVHKNVSSDYPDYLRDESRLTGRAESISFPESEAEIREVVSCMSASGVPVTTQAARTGITGGATPDGGHILNLSRMNRITGLRQCGDAFFLTVQPGVLRSQIADALAAKEFETEGWTDESLAALELFGAADAWFYPPDPTEASAAMGGMVACNASGARTFRYGPTRDYVERLRVVLVNGRLLEFCRGRDTASGRTFLVKTEDGETISGVLPSYVMPKVKNAAGYYAGDGMDILDLFVGSEGTLGIISEIEIRLMPAPRCIWGVCAFLPDEQNAVEFVKKIRTTSPPPAAIEFLDTRALDLLRAQKDQNPAFGDLPPLPREHDAAVCVEYHGESEDVVSDAVMAMSDIMVGCGGSEDATWVADNHREMERMKKLRHAVPEAVNLMIDERRKTFPSITKLSTDMAVPEDRIDDAMRLYCDGLENSGLEYVKFGHIGDNHIHVNVIPKDEAEYVSAKELFLGWARAVIAMGGTVSAEHGIGKVKVAFLREMYGDKGIEEMRAVKKSFDPDGLLNRGNLFENGIRIQEGD